MVPAINLSPSAIMRTSVHQKQIDAQTKEAFLNHYGLLKLTMAMAALACWIHDVQLSTRGKHYFMDDHKKPETLKCCNVCTKWMCNGSCLSIMLIVVEHLKRSLTILSMLGKCYGREGSQQK